LARRRRKQSKANQAGWASLRKLSFPLEGLQSPIQFKFSGKLTELGWWKVKGLILGLEKPKMLEHVGLECQWWLYQVWRTWQPWLGEWQQGLWALQ
jgi:hypothetical protein